MTSDTTKAINEPSLAQIQLEFALGDKRVHLKDLTEQELAVFLTQKLLQVELRELRGFTPLTDALERHGDVPISVGGEVEPLFVGFPADMTPTLRTQAIRVCRGVCSQTITYKRMESGEETSDYQVAKTWGMGAYITRGEERILVMLRPSTHARATDNLVVVDYGYTKVLHAYRFEIQTILATQLPPQKFSAFLGKAAPEIARDLMWEIRTIHARTLSDLAGQAEWMRKSLSKWERISDSIG